MTLPVERFRAIVNTSNAAMALSPYAVRKTGNQQLAKVPIGLLQDLLMSLRHYPGMFDLEELAKARPDILQAP